VGIDKRLFDELTERTDFTRIPLTWISGVEVTQSIQYYRADQHLTDPNDRGPNNSVRLVASKPAWVRVYYRSLWPIKPTATLEVRRRIFGFLWMPVATLNPLGASGVVGPSDYNSERTNTANTINFVIPAAQFTGNLRLRVQLSNGGGADTETVYINAALRQTLRLRSILVSYNGPATANVPAGAPAPPNVTLAAPTLADAQATSALARLMMPVRSTGVFTSAGTVAWTRPLDDPRTGAGGCSNNWNALLTQLGNVRTNDGNRADVVYYGLLPAGIPIGVPGCGVGGLGAGRAGDQGTLVHEIGHGYGFQHTPCGNTGASDANYPTYEPYPSASIGEYGFNIANGTVWSPANAKDYMSYCGPAWMSLYQHNRLINHPRLNPESVGDDPIFVDKLEYREYFAPRDLPRPPDPWKQLDMRFNPIISITGIVHAADEVEVVTVARVDAAGSPSGDRTGLIAQLVDGKGRVVSRAPLMRLRTHGDCGCDEEGEGDEDAPYAFQAYVPNVERGAELRITDGEKVVWERRGADRAPKVGRVSADVTDDGRLHLAWEADMEGGAGEVWVQWSDDRGETWHGLTTGLLDPDTTVDLAGVPSGQIQLRLLVNDGFDTTVTRPVSIRIPARPPEVVVLAPNEGDMLITGRPMRLWAQASNPDGTPLDEQSGIWSVDDKEVGEGFESWIEAPPVGDHRATFALDRKFEASVTFRTVDPEADFGEGADR
jgi:hypothetical protein